MELSDEQLEIFFRGWTAKFVRGEWPAAPRFTQRERAVIGLATCYFVARFPQARVMHAGLCFVANKIVRVIARGQGMRAEPLTVTVAASHQGGELALGSTRPRIRRVPMGHETFQTWSGHEIIHFPDHSAIYDPTIPQLSTFDVAVLPTAAEAPASLREGDQIPALLDAAAISAVYTVQRSNFDYMRMRFWPDIERIATEGIEVVGPAADKMVAELRDGDR